MNPERFLYSLVNYEKVPGYHYDLEAYKLFLEKIGSPQKKLKNVVLIAGTKGKGSTAAIINSCLIANGYRVGLFTSPHLLKITERIKINNQEITKKEMLDYIKLIKPHINFKTRIGARTFFEVLTSIALMYFAEKKVDFAVLEVGLGGRFDATNVFDSHISVITRIGYDHMNLLGRTLSSIASEKAGIIPEWKYKKESAFLITIHQRQAVEKTLQKIAKQHNHKIIYADELYKMEIKNMTIYGTKLGISGMLGKFDTYLPIPGNHQTENLQIALTVLQEFRNFGFKINTKKIKEGIKNARIQGRFEVISKRPLTIYDVAHNEDSFKALYRNIEILKQSENNFADSFFYMIFGCNQDKKISYAIKNIFPLAKEVLLVKVNNPRAMEPLHIYRLARKYQKNLLIAGSIRGALDYINAKRKERTIVLVFGSFYLYPEVYLFYHHHFSRRSLRTKV